MKNLLRVATISALVLGWFHASSAAAPRLEAPRPHDTVRGYFTANTDSNFAPIAIGKPSSFAVGHAWIVSDSLLNVYTTDISWLDNEFLGVFGGFYTATPQSVTTILQVKNQSGAIVATDTYSGTPVAGAINYIVMDIGVLPADPYKVILKFKQGAKVVGIQFWMGVFTSTSAQ